MSELVGRAEASSSDQIGRTEFESLRHDMSLRIPPILPHDKYPDNRGWWCSIC